MKCVPIEESDQPGHPPSLTILFSVTVNIWRRDWVDAQADQGLRLANILFCRFCHVCCVKFRTCTNIFSIVKRYRLSSYAAAPRSPFCSILYALVHAKWEFTIAPNAHYPQNTCGERTAHLLTNNVKFEMLKKTSKTQIVKLIAFNMFKDSRHCCNL